MNILLVTRQKGIGALLEQAGFNVTYVMNLKQARAELIGDEVDAVVCDMRDGAIDGVALLSEVRGRHDYLPFVLCASSRVKVPGNAREHTLVVPAEEDVVRAVEKLLNLFPSK